MSDEGRSWIERYQTVVVIALIAVPLAIASGMKKAGASNTAADLTQIILGVLALAVVTTVVMRSRRERDHPPG